MSFKNAQDAVNRMPGPAVTGSIAGNLIAQDTTANVYYPKHNGQAVELCVGAGMTSDGTSGKLWVHLQDDTKGTYFPIPLTPGNSFYCSFDAVYTDRSNVTLDSKLYLYPYTYRTASNVPQSNIF